jgi:hypothetical protein
MLNHTGATTIDATTTTSTQPILSGREQRSLTTVHRALKTGNPDSVQAAAVQLCECTLKLLNEYGHGEYFTDELRYYRQEPVMIYHSFGPYPHQRRFNIYYYPPSSETPEDERGHCLSLHTLKLALCRYKQAKDAATPREPESPTTPCEPESPTSVCGM